MKSEVYSWRLDPDLKSSLEHAARRRDASVASLLDEIVRAWLRESQTDEDEAAQRRLHAEARRWFGTARGGDPELAEQASERIRRDLEKRYETDGSA